MLPMEAFNSSTEGATNSALSVGRGLILILNFLRWSSSSSDSLDEKKWLFSLGVGKQSLRRNQDKTAWKMQILKQQNRLLPSCRLCMTCTKQLTSTDY